MSCCGCGGWETDELDSQGDILETFSFWAGLFWLVVVSVLFGDDNNVVYIYCFHWFVSNF